MGKPKKMRTKAVAAPPPSTPGKKIKKMRNKKNKGVAGGPPPSVNSTGPPSIPVAAPVANNSKVAVQGGQMGSESGRRTSGFIFMCSAKTKPECYRYRVFGLPKGNIEVVEKIQPGTKLFLFDIDLKLLYGVYRATSNGGMNLEPAAFRGGYPAQVKFKIDKDCLPLPENAFRHAIQENYEKNKFKSELNSRQVRKLLSLFRPITLNEEPVPAPQMLEDRRPPPPARLPREDPYRSGHVARVPPIDPRYVHQNVPPANDHYVPSVHYSRAPAMDPRLVPAAVPPPPNDPYYHAPPNDPYYHAPPSDPYRQAEPLRSYYPEQPLPSERFGYRVPEMIPREQVPAPARDYRSFTGREGEMYPRVDELYNPERPVTHAPAEYHPQQSTWASAYEDPYRGYADSVQRPVSSRTINPNVPVSSLYAFAGAAPAYR